MKRIKRPSRKRKAGRIALCTVLTLVVLFAVVSMVAIWQIFQAQFGRFERPDPATTTQMHYSDLGDDYPRELVSFTPDRTACRATCTLGREALDSSWWYTA